MKRPMKSRDEFMAEALAQRIADETEGAKEIRVSLESGALVSFRLVIGYVLVLSCVLCSTVQTFLLIWGFFGAPMGVGALLTPLWTFMLGSTLFLGFWAGMLTVLRMTRHMETRWAG